MKAFTILMVLVICNACALSQLESNTLKKDSNTDEKNIRNRNVGFTNIYELMATRLSGRIHISSDNEITVQGKSSIGLVSDDNYYNPSYLTNQSPLFVVDGIIRNVAYYKHDRPIYS